MGRVDCTENYLNSLPPTHQDMLLRYRQHLPKIRECLDQNYKIIRKFIQGAEHLFLNEHEMNLPKDNHNRRPNIRPQDHESVSSKSNYYFVVQLFTCCIFHNSNLYFYFTLPTSKLIAFLHQSIITNNSSSDYLMICIFKLLKVQITLKQFARDWSAAGAEERAQCYQPIIDEITKYYNKNLL